jgi:putative inorganic carbon (HCO3(-)) transporter
MRDIPVLVFLIGSLPVCFVRPAYGILVWTLMSFLNPQSFTWGVARYANLAVFVAASTLAGSVFSARWYRLFCREVLLMAVLWIWFTVTTLNSAYDPVFAEKAADAWYHWSMVSKIFLMTAVTVGIIDSWKRLRWLALAIAGSFGFLVLKSLPMIILTGGAFRVYGPGNTMIADNNDFGLALNMALPFFFFLAKTETNRWLKGLSSFLFVTTIPIILFTYSRGALVGLIAVLFCMLLQAKQKTILIPLTLLVFLFAAFLTPEAWKGRMSTDNAMNSSALSRVNAWTYSWNLAIAYPLMGGGFEAFTPSLFAQYAPNARDVHGPHSIYFGVLAEHGFTGLFLYLSLVVSSFAGLRRIVRTARLNGDERSASYAHMLGFGLVGFLTSGAFLGRAYFDFFFSIVACIAILRQLCQAEWAQDSPDSEVSGELLSEEAGF